VLTPTSGKIAPEVAHPEIAFFIRVDAEPGRLLRLKEREGDRRRREQRLRPIIADRMEGSAEVLAVDRDQRLELVSTFDREVEVDEERLGARIGVLDPHCASY
jgi:hypothetical protein